MAKVKRNIALFDNNIAEVVMKHTLNIDKTGLERGTRGNFDFPVLAVQHGVEIMQYEGEQFACHFHPEAELTLIASGKMYYRANDMEYLLCEGDAVFVNANVMHAGRSCDGASCVYHPINFWPLFLSGHEDSRIDRKYVAPLLGEALPSVVMRADCPEDAPLLEVVNEVCALARVHPDGWELLLKAALCRLWYYFYLRRPADAEERPIGAEAVKRAISFMETHYAEKLSLDDLAREAHLSRSEFCRTFRRYTGRTAFDYLQHQRVLRSLVLLREPRCPVLEVALSVGFSGASYYAEIFRRDMGTSPLEWRKKFL